MKTAKTGHFKSVCKGQFRKTDITRFTDEQLITLIAHRRSEKAFRELHARYRKRIFLMAFKITNNHCEAEDVVQEVSLTLYRKAHTFRRESKFSTWLYRLVINEAISRLRKIKKDRAISLDDSIHSHNHEGRQIEMTVVDWSQDVENRAAAREMLAIIENAIGILSPVDRTIVVLSEKEGLTNPEIGQVLGMSVAAVKARLHRARLFLKRKVLTQLGY